MVSILDFLKNHALSLATGGVAGVFLSQYLSWRRQRTDIAFKLIEQFLARYTELATVEGLLLDPHALALPQNVNRVFAVGDWMETAALLCRGRVANGQLVRRCGIHKQMSRFRDVAEQANRSDIAAALTKWTEMDRFAGS